MTMSETERGTDMTDKTDSTSDKTVTSAGSDSDPDSDATSVSSTDDSPPASVGSTPNTSEESLALAPASPDEETKATPTDELPTQAAQSDAPQTETASLPPPEAKAEDKAVVTETETATLTPPEVKVADPDIVTTAPLKAEPKQPEVETSTSQPETTPTGTEVKPPVVPGAFPVDPDTGTETAAGTAKTEDVSTLSRVSYTRPSHMKEFTRPVSTCWRKFKSRYRSPFQRFKREKETRKMARQMMDKEDFESTKSGLIRCLSGRSSLLDRARSRQTSVSISSM